MNCSFCNARIAIAILWVFLCACTSKQQYESYEEAVKTADRVDEISVNTTESYSSIKENDFMNVSEHPLSTFSSDVDAASYANVRRFISSQQLPPVDAVRIEELINYFDYDYPQPIADKPFSITTEVGVCPWNKNHHLVHIGLQGKKLETEDMPASNLVFLIDVSGSMSDPTKLPLLQKSFVLLTEKLRAKDRIALVVYAGAAGLVLPSTSGADKATILRAIENLQAGGSTAGGEGIELAYQVAEGNFIRGGNNRILLATDGDFNVGMSSDREMVEMIEEKRKSGIFLTVLGFGTGNYKDSKMEAIADHGNGTYYYIDSELEAKKVMVSEITGTLFTIAQDVKIQVEFNPMTVHSYRLLGYENRLMDNTDFRDNSKDAGEIGAGHSVTALYEIELKNTKEQDQRSLKYERQMAATISRFLGELVTFKVRYKQPHASTIQELTQVVDKEMIHTATSDDFRFSAVVAAYGLLLRNSEYKSDASYEKVLSWAKNAKGADLYGNRENFIELVEASSNLSDDVILSNE